MDIIYNVDYIFVVIKTYIYIIETDFIELERV